MSGESASEGLAAGRGGVTRILLVDDHRMVREGFRAILERERGFSVVGEASNGREALRVAQELRPDVVVMDIAMEDLNGVEATRQLRSLVPGARVVALSSHADVRYVTAILEAGGFGYVLKSNSHELLATGVRAAARGLKYLSPEVTTALLDRTAAQGGRGSAYELLGPREREVLQLLAEGLTSARIAERLELATGTVETHRRNIMRKLGLHSVADLTRYAIREGLTSEA